MRPGFPALLLVVVLALTGCSSLEGTGDKGYISGEGRVVQVAADQREEPIELTGEDLEGRPVSLADERGQVVVVNVWWSQCPPCREEMPTLVDVAARTDARFLGLNIRDSDQAQAQAFARSFDVPYPSLFDPSGQALLAFEGTLPPQSVPSTVVLDPEGRVAATVVGPVPSQATLEGMIEDAGGSVRG